MRVMVIHRIDDSALPAVGSDEEVAFDRDIDLWDTEMRCRGVLGGRLEVSTATKISMCAGEVLGRPFAETKEQIASYIMLECANLAEAIEISSRHPTVRYGGFELRRLAD